MTNNARPNAVNTPRKYATHRDLKHVQHMTLFGLVVSGSISKRIYSMYIWNEIISEAT